MFFVCLRAFRLTPALPTPPLQVLNCADGLCDVRWIDLHLAEVVEGNAVTKAQVTRKRREQRQRVLLLQATGIRIALRLERRTLG